MGHPVLHDPRRLSALKALSLLDTPNESAFDRITRFAASVTNVPVSLISLVDGNRQWFKSAVGLQNPWASRREIPMSYSVCQYVVTGQKPLVINDTRKMDFLRDNLAISELNVISYLGIPLTTSDGYTMGALCIIDHQPRDWSDNDVDCLENLAANVVTLMEMRAQIMNMTSISEAYLHDMTAQLAQVESNRKEETQHYHTVMIHTIQMLEQNYANNDVLAFLKGIRS